MKPKNLLFSLLMLTTNANLQGFENLAGFSTASVSPAPRKRQSWRLTLSTQEFTP